jgi:hypothetical protein
MNGCMSQQKGITISLYPQGCLPITNPKDHRARMQNGLFKQGEYPIDFLFLNGHMMRPGDFGVPHFTLLATAPHLVVHRFEPAGHAAQWLA